MISSLKQNNIIVAGADKIDLTDHIAILDIIAISKLALLTEDDLTVANVLKSPFIENHFEGAYFPLASKPIVVFVPTFSGWEVLMLFSKVEIRSTTSKVYRLYKLKFNEALPILWMLVISYESVYSGNKSGFPVEMLKLFRMFENGFNSLNLGLRILFEYPACNEKSSFTL